LGQLNQAGDPINFRSGEELMEINERIIEEIANYEACTGHRPTAVYLGRSEIRLLKKWVRAAFRQRFGSSSRLNGIRIYGVREKNHLGIGRRTIDKNK